MAYRDPYAGQYAREQYGDTVPDFNPYNNAAQRQPHPTYEQGDVGPSYDNYDGEYRDEPVGAGGSALPAVPPKERSVFDPEDFTPRPRERTARALRQYRYDSQGSLWAKGSRGRCVGRFCCCTLMIAAFLFISIILALALWIRPPRISINNVSPTNNGSTIQLQTGGVIINLGVNISVNNPNYFNVDFKKISAEIFYPINNTAIGGGSSSNINFPSHTQTNFTFPFAIDYQTSLDPDSKILFDLANKCGIIGTESNIVVDYKITLALRVLFVTISPVVSNSFSFVCPLDASDIEGLAKSAGISLPGTS